MTERQQFMRFAQKRACLGAVIVSAALVAGATSKAAEVDLTAEGDTSLHQLTGAVGGNAWFGNFTTHPAGTGVFDPFLTLERDASGGHPAGIEGAYNTDGHTAMYLDQQRPEWNTRLQLQDLAKVTVQGSTYYAFELDANEPNGQNKNLLSIDNIRIYTSAADNTAAVGNDESKLGQLGDLRWAMNDPLKNPDGSYKIDNWVKLDSSLSDQLKKANGGSGWSDMIVYVPTSAFDKAALTDYVWFYNLNGVHFAVDDPGTAAEAGYEEWRAVQGQTTVPDGGSTLMLLGMALSAVAAAGRSFGKK